MVSLAQLKKKKGSNLKKLQEKLEKSAQGGAPRDERIWKPKFNKDKGKGTAIVRFLPAKEGDPFVEQLSYSFNGPGGNFWDLARQTAGEEDPVQICAINMFRKAKNEDDKKLKEKAKKFLPKRQYFANVHVIKDEENPENEGKEFIYQFGPAIYKKLKEKIQPEFDDVDPMDPFDLWTGADFKIRMVGTEIPDSKTGKMITVPNYDNSEFAPVSEFKGGDEDILEEIFQRTYDLSEFVDPSKLKSFEEVAERFKKVTGFDYRHYDAEFVEDHLEEKTKEEKLDRQQDNSTMADSHREEEQENEEEDDDGKPPFDMDDDDDDDDPVARFKKLAGGG